MTDTLNAEAGQSQRLTLAGPAGSLEAVVDLPESGPPYRHFAVVCHPHPQYGGTLDNKVVYMLARAFGEAGMPALRFNFRGAGRSEGRFDEGVGEVDDALAALDWAGRQWPDAAPSLAGFSFGAYVALRVAARRRPGRLVTVAPPVRYFGGQRYEPPDCPWLLIQGEADEVVSAREVLDWAKALARPPEIRSLPEVGHFFHGSLPALREAVLAFLTEHRDARQDRP